MMRNHSRGFTLLELLMVIGILALLVGLLFPVVTRVQRSAKIAATQQLISTLGNAIQQYQQEFGALPGPRQQGAALTFPGVGGNVTTSEELLLSLRGGVKWDGAVLAYDPAEIGRGPFSLNPANRKRYRDFLSTTVETSDINATTAQYGGDSIVPEFVDTFGEGKPILYLRANKGATGIAGVDPQWNISELGVYDFPINDAGFADLGDFADADAYFRNPSMPEQTRQKDSFILISAGPDGKYGTKDDITNFGTPGE